ncbi:unnamed protein product [Timema podura]|uniref:Uncharacterized protein n=1 Tax=Timema podura TaxID=61482 RepID=A0ABN7P8Q0_TIMPD|nr:unnamed protein product [Timema podura]
MSEAMLQYKYDYATQIMDIGPHGLAHGVITDLHVNLDIILNTSNTSDITVALQDLTLEHAGNITVLLDGSIGVLNAIVDAISNVITTIFKDQILGLIQNKVESAVKSAVADLHFSI